MPARQATLDAERAENERLWAENVRLRKANAAATATLSFATRAAGMIDSAQVAGLKNQIGTLERRIEALTAENVHLASELETALAALSARASGEPWIGEQDPAVAS